MTALTTIFGSEIKVHLQPRVVDRQYVGFPGAHGLAGMYLGTRGRQLVISGTLAYYGADYETARENLQGWIDDIEFYLSAESADYSFMGQTFENVVFDAFQLIPDAAGKVFYYTAEGYVTCRFVCYGRALI